MSTSDPDQQITMNLLTNQYELNSATVLDNTNLTHIDYLLCAKHCSRPFTWDNSFSIQNKPIK